MTVDGSLPAERGPAIVGNGRMAGEYVKALRVLGLEPSVVIGRNPEHVRRFAEAHSIATATSDLGGLEPAQIGPGAIVAASHDALAPVTARLLKKGVRSILLEKPGALDLRALRAITNAAHAASAKLFIAYNRRFYPWVEPLTRSIEADGGLQSCHMEFTEWESAVLAENVSETALRRWGLVNSTHVLDLGFFFAGEPTELHAVVSGRLEWHSSGSIFVGAGRTDHGVVFSYASNWGSAGRWRIDLMTARRRFILAPLERPQVQNRGEIDTTPFTFTPRCVAAGEVKMGFVEQVEAFVAALSCGRTSPQLFTAKQQVRRWPYYCMIFGYDD